MGDTLLPTCTVLTHLHHLHHPYKEYLVPRYVNTLVKEKKLREAKFYYLKWIHSTRHFNYLWTVQSVNKPSFVLI